MMMKQAVKVFALIFSITISGVALSDHDFKAAWEAANAQRKAAKAAGHEWRDTKRKLEEAIKLAEAGDMEAAMSMLQCAQTQADAAIAQSEREELLWESRVPKLN